MSSAVDYPGDALKPDRRHVIGFLNIIRDHVGTETAITSGELEGLLQMDEAHDSNPKVREIVRYCRRVMHVPIGSGTTGYYLISDEQELAANLQHFNARIRGDMETKDAILEAVNRHGFADPREDYAGVVDVSEVVEDGE